MQALRPHTSTWPGPFGFCGGLFVVALGLMAMGCSDLFGPSLPPDRTPLNPLPSSFEHWWAVVETCSGLEAELGRVAWWVLPGEDAFPDGESNGRYYRAGHQIGLTESAVENGFVVRHEMLHAVLSSNLTFGHPKEFFENRCGGIVSCGGDCRAEVGGTPAEASRVPFVHEGDIEVSVDILPRVMRHAPPIGECVTIVVGAKYVGGEVAAMDLSGRVFSWTVRGLGGGGGGGPIPPNDTILMEPGAVRYYAYDCPRRFETFEPGEYHVGGTWRGVLSEDVTLTIVP